MEVVKIRINSIEDAKAGIPIVEGIEKDLSNAHVTKEPITFAILEAGMKSGKCSLMVILNNPDGTYSIGEFTQDHLEMLNASMRGAIERFGQ